MLKNIYFIQMFIFGHHRSFRNGRKVFKPVKIIKSKGIYFVN